MTKKKQTVTRPSRPVERRVRKQSLETRLADNLRRVEFLPPIQITHDSSAGHEAFKELESLLKDNPDGAELLKKRFRRFDDLLIYKRISALRANRCKAGFQPTGKLLKFLAALRAKKREHNAVT